MSIIVGGGNGPANIPPHRGINSNGELRRTRGELGEALSSGNLEAARAAFSDFAAINPDRLAKHPDGSFARLQAALGSGDLEAAKAAYQQLPGVRKTEGQDTGLAVRQPSGDGTLGSLLDVSA